MALDHTSLPSSYFGGIVAERPERGRNSAKAEEATTRADHQSDRNSLFDHWMETTFHPLREFSHLSRREQITFVQKPHLFALWGMQKVLDVIEMHRDYIFD